MVLEVRMGPDDVAGIRFVLSPLHETVISLTRRDAAAVARRFLRPADQRVLALLCSPIEYLPDFITPVPEGPTVGFEEEVGAVRATPPDIVRRDFVATYEGQEVPPVLLTTACRGSPSGSPPRPRRRTSDDPDPGGPRRPARAARGPWRAWPRSASS
jgi:hypothetical protein